jgi:large subunit ribosomal protein L31e
MKKGMARKAKKPFEGERIYNIPLTESLKKARRKRVSYSVRLVRKYLETHTKSKNIKMGKHLNEALWARGIRKPARMVRVRAVRAGAEVRAELIGHDYTEFKAKPVKERKGMKEKLMERLGPKAIQKEEEEKNLRGQKSSEISGSKASQEIEDKKEEPKKEEKK